MDFSSKKFYYYLNANFGTGQWILTRQPSAVGADPEIELGRVIPFTDPAEYGIYVEIDCAHEALAFLKAGAAIHYHLKENKNDSLWRKDLGQL